MSRRFRHGAAAVALLALTGLAACAPEDAGANAQPQLPPAGKFTVATEKPAYPPWFVDDDPANGKGYESAVAYAVAEKLGFAKSEVSWIVVPFTNAYAPG